MPSPIRVMLLVNTLRFGGTERNVVEYRKSMDRTRFVGEIHTLVPAVRGSSIDMPQVCYNRHKAYDPTFAFRCARALADSNVDIIHVFSHAAAVYAAIARALFHCRKPLIYSEGTSLAHGGWTRHLYRWAFRQFDAFAANSDASRAKLIEDGIPPEQIYYIPNGHPLHKYRTALAESQASAREHLGFGEDETILVFCGRIMKSKRVEDLLQAIPRLQLSGSRLRVLIVGSGDDETDVRNLTEELGIQDIVDFCGYRKDVPRILRAADVFVFPSEIEGLPNSVIEAALMELPIVAADIPGTRNVVGSGEEALLVPCRDPAALAQAINQTLANLPARRLAAKRLATLVAQEFGIEKTLASLYRLYESVLHRNGLV